MHTRPARTSRYRANAVRRSKPKRCCSDCARSAVIRAPWSKSILACPPGLKQAKRALTYSKKLGSLIDIALNSRRTAARAASVELLTLVSEAYRQRARPSTGFLWTRSVPRRKTGRGGFGSVGLLASRGIETDQIRWLLLEFLHHPDVETRKWAVNSLSMLGTDDIIDPLLEVFGRDPSMEVRERAGCGLAEGGMMTREQRRKAIPGLLRLMDDRDSQPGNPGLGVPGAHRDQRSAARHRPSRLARAPLTTVATICRRRDSMASRFVVHTTHRLHCLSRFACLRPDRHQGGSIEAFEDLARLHPEGRGSDAGGGLRLQADSSADELRGTAHASGAGTGRPFVSLFQRQAQSRKTRFDEQEGRHGVCEAVLRQVDRHGVEAHAGADRQNL